MNDKKKERILITGANGFVGKSLVIDLINNPAYDLIINSRKEIIHVENETEHLIQINADLTDETAYEQLFVEYQPDIVIHLAAMARIAEGENYPEEAMRVNYEATLRLTKLAVRLKSKTFVFVSTDLARNFQSVVGISKYFAEAALQEIKSPFTKLITVRLPNISWTPGSVHTIFENLINQNKAITITHPDMSRRFIEAEDAIEYIKYAMVSGSNKDIFVVDTQPIKITDLATEMIASSGKNINIEYIGIRAGEKLAEESYSVNEIVHTSFKNLALLKSNRFEPQYFAEAENILRKKPGIKNIKLIKPND